MHDPKTVKAGVEIRTKFGFNTEPIDGFAHYAEHVFFRGTENVTEFDIFSVIGKFNDLLMHILGKKKQFFNILVQIIHLILF